MDKLKPDQHDPGGHLLHHPRRRGENTKVLAMQFSGVGASNVFKRLAMLSDTPRRITPRT